MPASSAQLGKYEQALYYEIFIKEEYRIAKPTIQNAKTIFDIGGHLGFFSERCLSLNPHLQLHYFEPFDALFQQAKIRLQNFAPQITFNPFAIASSTGTATFTFNASKTMQSSKATSFLNPAGIPQQVHTQSLNQYIKEQKIWSIDLVKLDIEGMEFEVLFALEPATRSSIKALLCEVHLLTESEAAQFPHLQSLLSTHFAQITRLPSPYSSKINLCFCQNPL